MNWIGRRQCGEGQGERHRDRIRDRRQQERSGAAAGHGAGRAAHHLARLAVRGPGRSAASMSSASTIATPACRPTSARGACPTFPAALQKVMKGEKVDAPYLLKDMAADAIGLLDALGIDKRAHGRRLDGRHDRADRGGAVSRSARARWCRSIRPAAGRGLPQGKPEALAMLSAQPEGPAREQLVAHGMKLRQTIGSPGYPTPEAELRAFVEKNVDRRWYPEGVGAAVSLGHRLGRPRRAAEDRSRCRPWCCTARTIRCCRSSAAATSRAWCRARRSRPIPAGATISRGS